MSRTDCYTATVSNCRGGEISTRAEQTITVSLQGWCDLYMSRTDCYTATVSHCEGGVISTWAEQTVTVSLQGWCDLYTSTTDCFTVTVSHCRGGEISTWAEQTVTLLLSLIVGVVRSLHEQNRLFHCYCLSLQGLWDLYMNRTDCYTVTVSLRGWCNLYTSRTDCYTATASHCRGGLISTRAEQTVTLVLSLIAGVVRSLHEQNRLLHCYCLSLQGWWDLYTSRTDYYTATVSHCRGCEISTGAEQTVTLLLPLFAGVVWSLHEQNRLLHSYCLSLQGWWDLYMNRTDCYTATVSHCRGGEISTRAEQTITLLLSLIAGVVRSLHEQNRLLHCYCLSLQGWCDLYTSRTDCYTATVSLCRGGEISTWAEQTVTLLLHGDAPLQPGFPSHRLRTRSRQDPQHPHLWQHGRDADAGE